MPSSSVPAAAVGFLLQDWADQHGVSGTYAQIVSSPEAHDMVQTYVDSLNVNLNRWEQVKRFTILDHDLTVEAGDLTPSLKLRRKAVSEKYRDTLDAAYSS